MPTPGPTSKRPRLRAGDLVLLSHIDGREVVTIVLWTDGLPRGAVEVASSLGSEVVSSLCLSLVQMGQEP